MCVQAQLSLCCSFICSSITCTCTIKLVNIILFGPSHVTYRTCGACKSSFRLLLKHGTAFTKTRNGTEQNATEWNENKTGKKRNAAEQTYGTEMIIMECNVLLWNVVLERDIVGITLLSIIILNERSSTTVPFLHYFSVFPQRNKNGTVYFVPLFRVFVPLFHVLRSFIIHVFPCCFFSFYFVLPMFLIAV